MRQFRQARSGQCREVKTGEIEFRHGVTIATSANYSKHSANSRLSHGEGGAPGPVGGMPLASENRD